MKADLRSIEKKPQFILAALPSLVETNGLGKKVYTVLSTPYGIFHKDFQQNQVRISNISIENWFIYWTNIVHTYFPYFTRKMCKIMFVLYLVYMLSVFTIIFPHSVSLFSNLIRYLSADE